MKYVVVTGNPVDGLFFYGPFDANEATSWAEAEQDGQDYWIAPLVSREKYEEDNFPPS